MIDLSNYSIFEIYLYFFKNANNFNVNLYKGVLYITLHILYGCLILLSLLLITNINYLFIVYIFMCINCFVIYKFRRCPLAELERYNINFSCVDYIFKYLYSSVVTHKSKNKKKTKHPGNPTQNKKKPNVCFKHLKYNNVDEISLENLIVGATCIVCKIMIIMIYENFMYK